MEKEQWEVTKEDSELTLKLYNLFETDRDFSRVLVAWLTNLNSAKTQKEKIQSGMSIIVALSKMGFIKFLK